MLQVNDGRSNRGDWKILRLQNKKEQEGKKSSQNQQLLDVYEQKLAAEKKSTD